jgi:hypothetical protein
MPMQRGSNPPPLADALVGADRTLTPNWRVWLDMLGKRLLGSATITEAAGGETLAAGDVAVVEVTDPAILAGAFAVASYVPLPADVSVSASVSSAGTVRVWFRNEGASPVTVPAGTLRIRLEAPS